MKKNGNGLKIFFAMFFVQCMTNSVWAQKTTLSAEIYGYGGDMIYFDCVQSPFIRAEFHTNPGEEHLYSFDATEPTCMIINGRNNVLLSPGDSIHVVIRYDGRNVQSMNFTGADRAVLANRAMQKVENIKKQMRYKNQLLTCLALDVKPEARIRDSKILLAKVDSLLETISQKTDKSLIDYIKAGTEAAAYTSFMEYPVMYAETHKLPSAKGDDYWKLMEGVNLRDSKGALACPEYLGFLMRYSFFLDEKKALESGNDYKMPDTFEDMYASIAKGYKGAQRDAALYMLICNFIRSGKKVERAIPVVEDYKANYNINKDYSELLEKLLQ